MSKAGATSINIQICKANSENHNLRAIGITNIYNYIDAELAQIGQMKGPTAKETDESTAEQAQGQQKQKEGPSEGQKEKAKPEIKQDWQFLSKMPAQARDQDPETMRIMQHVNPELTPLNEAFITASNFQKVEELKLIVKAQTGQKMQKKCTPLKEGVIVIKPETTIDDLRKFGQVIEKEFGWHATQFFIHHDEGHVDDETGKWIENHHAHIIFDTINHETGKTIQLNRVQLSQMQTILSEVVSMERGESSDRIHLKMVEFKEQAERASMRHNLALSVQNVGYNPRQMLAEPLLSAIRDAVPATTNDRTALNTLRKVGKEFDLAPSRLCVQAIIDKLQADPTPDKIADLCEALDIVTITMPDITNMTAEQKNSEVAKMVEKIRVPLYDVAVKCGKMQNDAKAFRPILNAAKALEIDLAPVMLQPIEKAIQVAQEMPLTKENTNKMWNALCIFKIDPLPMLQEAQTEGLDSLKEQATQAVQVRDVAEHRTNEIDSIVSEVVEMAGEKMPDAPLTDKLDKVSSIVADIQDNTQKALAQVKSVVGLSDAATLAQRINVTLGNAIAEPKSMTKDDAANLFKAFYAVAGKPCEMLAKPFYPYFDTLPDDKKLKVCKALLVEPTTDAKQFKENLQISVRNLDEMGVAGLQQNPFLLTFLPYVVKNLAVPLKMEVTRLEQQGDISLPTLKMVADSLKIDVPKVIAEVDKSAVKELQKQVKEVRNLNATKESLSFVLDDAIAQASFKMPQNANIYDKICAVKEIAREYTDTDTQMPRIQQAFQRGAEQGRSEIATKVEALSKDNAELQQKFVSVSEKLAKYEAVIFKSALKFEPIKKLYDAGLTAVDKVVELAVSFSTRFSGLLFYSGEKIDCQNAEISIHEGDPEPKINGKNIDECVEHQAMEINHVKNKKGLKL